MKTAAECPKCAFTLHLSEEELNLFFPNFACLRCGHRFPLPIDKAAYRKLRRNNFRDPMPPPVNPSQINSTVPRSVAG